MRIRERPKRQRVGYQVPPINTRFRPGTSGNPRGRPRGSKNFNTLMGELMTQRVTVTENGRRRSLPAIEALLKRILAQALQGDSKSINHILKLFSGHVDTTPDDNTEPNTPEKDSEIIRRTLDRLIEERQKASKK